MASSHAGIIRTPDSVGTYQDSDGGEGRHFPSPPLSAIKISAANSSLVLIGRFDAISGAIGQPLAFRTFYSDGSALHVINAQLGACVLPEIKFGEIAVEMLGIDVLVNADHAALEHAEEAFERVGMHVAARPFVLE